MAPSTVDRNIFPHATGQALQTVQAHSDVASQDGVAPITLYSGWFCPFVQRVWIAIEEKRIPYIYKEENPYHKDEEFLKISPKGLVPAIICDGKPLNESLVILEFLEDRYPESNPLLPKDPYRRAQVRLAVDQISKAIIPLFYKLMQAQDKELQDVARDNFYAALRTFEAGIEGPFWAGDQFTLADVAIIPFIFRMSLLERHRGFIASQVGTKFVEWKERVLKLPSVTRTLSDEERYEAVYERYLNNTTQSLVGQATRDGTVLP